MYVVNNNNNFLSLLIFQYYLFFKFRFLWFLKIYSERSCRTISDKVIRAEPKKDILVVLGDWKAKWSRSEAYQQREGKVGIFGLGKTSYKGLGLMELAQDRWLTIANTLQEWPAIHLWSKEGLKQGG